MIPLVLIGTSNLTQDDRYVYACIQDDISTTLNTVLKGGIFKTIILTPLPDAGYTQSYSCLKLHKKIILDTLNINTTKTTTLEDMIIPRDAIVYITRLR